MSVVLLSVVWLLVTVGYCAYMLGGRDAYREQLRKIECEIAAVEREIAEARSVGDVPQDPESTK